MKKINTKFLIVYLSISATLFILNDQITKIEKIAIAADGEKTESRVEFQGGRAQWLILFDEKGGFLESLENPFYQERSQAGVKCAEFLEEKNITIFVAGNIGNKMAAVLEDFEIVFVSFTGTVDEAITHVLEK